MSWAYKTKFGSYINKETKKKTANPVKINFVCLSSPFTRHLLSQPLTMFFFSHASLFFSPYKPLSLGFYSPSHAKQICPSPSSILTHYLSKCLRNATNTILSIPRNSPTVNISLTRLRTLSQSHCFSLNSHLHSHLISVTTTS